MPCWEPFEEVRTICHTPIALFAVVATSALFAPSLGVTKMPPQVSKPAVVPLDEAMVKVVAVGVLNRTVVTACWPVPVV